MTVEQVEHEQRPNQYGQTILNDLIPGKMYSYSAESIQNFWLMELTKQQIITNNHLAALMDILMAKGLPK